MHTDLKCWDSERQRYPAGRAVKAWAMDELQCGFVGSFEIPFATANGKVVTRESCREFGHDVARALAHGGAVSSVKFPLK